MSSARPAPRTLVAVAAAVLIPSVVASVTAHRALDERRQVEASERRARQRSLDHARARQDVSVALIASRLTAAGAPDDASAWAATGGLSGVRSVEVVGADGAVLARGAPAERSGPRCPPRVLSRPAHAGVTVVVTLDDECDALVTPPARSTGTGAHLATGAAALVAAVLALLLLRGAPSRGRATALITAAGRVGGGDLAVRVEPAADGELEALTAAFNRMVEELAQYRARVEYLQRIAGWQELARRLAHEIKNPLTPIQLSVQELAKRYRGDDRAFAKTLETTREVVEEEVATLRRLVGAFSEFAQLPDVKPAPADLAEFVRDMASSRALLDSLDPGVAVTFDAGDVAVPVRIDRIMFRRAVENLVRNAVEALVGRGGQVRVRVEVRSVREAEGAEPVEQAWLVVEDDGPGVPAAQQAKIFDPYFTTKATGTGLGLAIVRKIALDHDGDVGLDDRPGGGARFVLTLPRATGERRRRSFVTFSKG